MRKLQEVPAGDVLAPAPETGPAGGAVAPGSLMLSNGLMLPPTARPLKALPGALELPFADYLRLPAPGRSNLDKIRVSPLHYQHCLRHPAPSTKAQNRGRVAHRLLLDPTQFWLETVKWPDTYDKELDAGGDKNKGEGSAKRWKAFQAKHSGKDIISEQDWNTYKELEELFRHHPQTRGLLVGAVTEATVLFERDGVLCKMRADIMRAADRTIDDVKVTQDLQQFLRDIEKYGAHRQGDWYLGGGTAGTGIEFTRFRLVVVQLPPEDKPLSVPIDLAVVEIGKDLLEDGREENDANLATYKRCVATGSWPGFAPYAPLVVGRAPWRAKA